MTASDMESMTMKELLSFASDEDRHGFENLWLGYTQSYGAPDLRREIAATYDNLSDENILCFAGAEEGIYTAMRCLLSSDDHAIVVVPNYQAAETIPLSICNVTGVPLQADNNWALDINEISKALRANTKLISINFPHNPTGKIITKEELEELVKLARDFDLYIFSDEVYWGIERDEKLRLPQVADIYEKGISLNVMSKAYGLPGLRIGWIACQDTELLTKFERYKLYLSICNSGPSERLAVIALKARQEILARNKAILDDNAAKLDEFFAEFPEIFEWKRPDGGAIAYPKYLKSDDCNNFCSDLLNKTGILVLPPKVYHSDLMDTPQNHFRIGYGRKNLSEMLDVFYHYLKKNTP